MSIICIYVYYIYIYVIYSTHIISIIYPNLHSVNFIVHPSPFQPCLHGHAGGIPLPPPKNLGRGRRDQERWFQHCHMPRRKLSSVGWELQKKTWDIMICSFTKSNEGTLQNIKSIHLYRPMFYQGERVDLSPKFMPQQLKKKETKT